MKSQRKEPGWSFFYDLILPAICITSGILIIGLSRHPAKKEARHAIG